jgi:hypothetical protein
MNTGDLLAEQLLAHGIDVVFGMTGGQGYMLNDALHRRRGRARHVMVRDERSSAYAADGWARVRGHLGVCDAAFGVGVLKLPSGLAEAYNSSIPVLAITSNAPRDWMLYVDRGCTAQGVKQLRGFELMCKRVFHASTQAIISDAVPPSRPRGHVGPARPRGARHPCRRLRPAVRRRRSRPLGLARRRARAVEPHVPEPRSPPPPTGSAGPGAW